MKLAIFWDLDNVKPAGVESVLNLTNKFVNFEIIHFTAYGDVRFVSSIHLDILKANNITYKNTLSNRKATTDLMMVSDIFNLIISQTVDLILLISEDRDFDYPLSQVRDHGIAVAVIHSLDEEIEIDHGFEKLAIYELNISQHVRQKTIKTSKSQTISYSETAALVVLSLSKLQRKIKHIDYASLDLEMRKSRNFVYQGVSSIITTGNKLSKFSELLKHLELEGFVELYIVNGVDNVRLSTGRHLATIQVTEAKEWLFQAIEKLAHLDKTSYLSSVYIKMRQLSHGKLVTIQQVIIEGERIKKFTDFIRYLESQGVVRLNGNVIEIT